MIALGQKNDENQSQIRYQEIRAEAENASGPLASLRIRAGGYLQIYETSQGVCRFSLVASHGALWASWYLVCAHLAAMFFAMTDLTCSLSPWARYKQFAQYAAALKDINKLVMVETYVLVYTIKELGAAFAIKVGIPEELAHDYAKAMEAKENDNLVLRDLYHRHFLWEQERVVSGKLDEAFEVFTWPFMRNLCQRPWVWFSYFRVGKSLKFQSFTDQTERVEKGLVAYDRAAQFGVSRVFKITKVRLKILPGFAWLPL
ncbi:MAG: hypothetical protein ABJK39_08175 [Hyphomicrobiales bacterium]